VYEQGMTRPTSLPPPAWPAARVCVWRRKHPTKIISVCKKD